jgi:hypothetical protein
MRFLRFSASFALALSMDFCEYAFLERIFVLMPITSLAGQLPR